MPDLEREAAADMATMTGGHDAWDTRTHIDRINGQGNPAWIPGQGVVHTRDSIGDVPRQAPTQEPDIETEQPAWTDVSTSPPPDGDIPED